MSSTPSTTLTVKVDFAVGDARPSDAALAQLWTEATAAAREQVVQLEDRKFGVSVYDPVADVGVLVLIRVHGSANPAAVVQAVLATPPDFATAMFLSRAARPLS